LAYGFWDRIAHVDLTNMRVEYESPGEIFFRRYIGGGCLGSYYVAKLTKPGTDAFSPDNVLVFAPSVATGVPVPGFARHSAVAISPLTGGISDSEAGGFWGVALKGAGLDAIVIRGQASKPVYLFVKDGNVEIRDASHLWGKFNLDVLREVEKELGEKGLRILGIGPGGENLVRFACIAADLHDMHGRGGLGAVMGSKRLKAILVKPTRKIPFKDEETLKKIAKAFASRFKELPGQLRLHQWGTTISAKNYSTAGQLPTRNWTMGVFEGVEKICGDYIQNIMEFNKSGCYACPVRCKRLVGAKEPFEIDSEYASLEFESLASLGSYTGVNDPYVVAKAIELANKYTIDTISLGGTIAFAMDCYENGILTKEDTDGLELTFGNKDVIIPLIEKIVKREGIGKILAEGSRRAAKIIGKGAEKFAVEAKGVEYPAHEPRVKRSLALVYSLSPIGADHMASEHDPTVGPDASDTIMQRIYPLGIYDKMPWFDLDEKKVRFVYYTMMAYSMFNSVDMCIFAMAPTRTLTFEELVDTVRAATGWNITLWELMKMGERRMNIMRTFNVRSGIDSREDRLAYKMLQPLQGEGPHVGRRVTEEEFENAKKLYYKMAGWDENGVPYPWKLIELELDWLL